MKKFPVVAFVILVSAVGGVYGWVRFRSEFASQPNIEPVSDSEPTPKHHLATKAMIDAGDESAGRPAPDFELPANDGGTYKLSEMLKDGPAVLIFIKDDCPCSIAADPFLKRVHAAGRGFVPFYGVIDGGVNVAQQWADRNNTVFPILADPERTVIQAYQAQNSAYVAFVGPDGRIERLWAGYSEEMLKELGHLMEPWVKPGMEHFDVADAPRELYSGCPY